MPKTHGTIAVLAFAFVFASFSLPIAEAKTATLGVYKLYINNNDVAQVINNSITKKDAKTNCKLNIAANPGKSIRCTWNDVEIFNSAAPQLGEYIIYIDGILHGKTEKISKSDALDNCQLNASLNPDKEVLCTWKGKEIFHS
jgi:hypothetical protein